MTTIVLLPLLVAVLVGVLELGTARVLAARIRHAADLAVLVAVDDQDDAALAERGVLAPAADAADAAREYFAANLAPIGAQLADDAANVAAAARIDVSAGPPATVRLEAEVPLRTPLFGALLGSPITRIATRSGAAAR